MRPPMIGLRTSEATWMKEKVMPIPEPGIPNCLARTERKGRMGAPP